MELVVPVLCMLGAVLVSSVVSHIFPKAPASLVQIALGLLLAVTPLHIEVTLDSEFFLLFFIAPLLYWDAFESDKKALWNQRRPVLALALGLVLLIVLVVGFFTHWLIPSIPLAAAFALAAALGPTDAVAVTTLGKRIDIPTRHKTMLLGEGLLNDASGVVSFQCAVAALVTGAFSIVEASESLLWDFLGGIGIGVLLALLKGLVVRAVRRFGLEDVTFHVLIQVLTPFAFFLLAENLGVSGILAVVAAGLVDSASERSMVPSAANLNIVSNSVWTIISFTLNGLVFVLLGMLLPIATSRTLANNVSNYTLLGYALLITLVLVAVRFVWCLATVLIEKDAEGRRQKLDRDAVMSATLLTLCGAKGAVTLSICLSIPRFVGTGEVLQSRELIIFLGAATILITLLMANFLVPLIVPKKEQVLTRTDETEARIKVLRDVVQSLATNPELADKRAVRRVIASYETRIDRLKKQTSLQDDSEARLREVAIGWEQECVDEQIRQGAVAPIVGYGYLIELERRLSKVQHRDQVRWFFRNARDFLRSVRYNGFKEWGVTSGVRRARHEARDRLRAACSQRVLDRLQALDADDGYPIEAILRIKLEYQRALATTREGMSRLTGSGSGAGAASGATGAASQATSQLELVQRTAIQLEREGIRQALEAGEISRETARSMRDNVAAIEYDVGSR